jgi:hypothetical protein
MNEYDVRFCFDGFIVITSVYCENDDQVEYVAIDKLAENGLDIEPFGRYDLQLEITAEIL